MPHDWINVHVDGEADARTIVKQCARCRLVAVVHESGERAAIDYYPQHIRAPQDCPRGDMTEERASEIAQLRAEVARLTGERDALLARVTDCERALHCAIVVDSRCPPIARAMLAGIADQIAKRQHFNSTARIRELEAWCMRDLRDVLNEDRTSGGG